MMCLSAIHYVSPNTLQYLHWGPFLIFVMYGYKKAKIADVIKETFLFAYNLVY